jgi:hypothetical protein
MPTYLYPLLVPVALALVGLFGWTFWLAFNWSVFKHSDRKVEAFDHTAQLAPAFLRWLRSPAASAADDNTAPPATVPPLRPDDRQCFCGSRRSPLRIAALLQRRRSDGQ